MSVYLQIVPIWVPYGGVLQTSVEKPTPEQHAPEKSTFSLWIWAIGSFRIRYFLTLLTGLFAALPGMFLVLLVTYAVSQLQGQPRLIAWTELVGEHASRWLSPLVRNTAFEDGLTVEHQRWFVVPILLACGFLFNLLRGLQEYLLENLGERIAYQLRHQFAESYLSSTYDQARRSQSSLVAGFLGDDCREIRQCFTRLCGSIPTELFNSFIYLTLLLLLDTQLFVLFFAIFVPAGIIVRTTGTYLRKLAKTGVHVQTELSQSFLEKMKGWQSIQSFRSNRLELSRFDEKNSTIFHIWRRSARAKALASPTVEWLGLTAGAFVLVLALRRVSEGALPSTILTAFLVTIAQLSGSLQTVVTQLNSTKKGSAVLRRLFENLKELESNKQNFVSQPAPFTARNIYISAEKMSLKQTGNANHTLFDNLHFSLRGGDALCIVGPSGSGKSTLLECVCGLRQPDSGSVTLRFEEGDTHINPSMSDYLKVAYLTQEPFFFVGTVAENICYPRNFDASNLELTEQILTALKMACLTNVGLQDSVLALSGGEKQRLAFARGFFARPHLWLIDEGTSALDASTEGTLLKNLDEFSKSAIKIFVAHRQSMQKWATQTIAIAKLESGRMT